MRFGIGLAMMVAGCAVAGASHARTAAPISKAQARSWPRSHVKRQVMEQLSAILTEERFPQKRPPKTMLTSMEFAMEPRATSVPGLCRIDRLSVEFRPEGGDGERDADTPVSVSGVDATRYYHFRRPPSDRFDAIVDYERRPDEAQCRGARLEEDAFFSAPDERAATDGYLVARRAMDAIVAGNPSFPLSCDLYPVEAKRSCAEVVGAIASEPLSSIEACQSDLPEFRSDICYRIFIGDRSLQIMASSYASGPNIPAPLTIKRVAMESLIVMAHERVD